jgi:hypothetical protein
MGSPMMRTPLLRSHHSVLDTKSTKEGAHGGTMGSPMMRTPLLRSHHGVRDDAA